MAIANVGAPACGMNAVTRAFVRLCLFNGINPWVIYGGFEGLVSSDTRKGIGGAHMLEWREVYGWANQGGSNLGTRRLTAQEVGLEKVAAAFKKYTLHGILIVGGFEAFSAGLQLAEARNTYPEFCIPILVIPATISNNVPGTDFSLGCDTALNEIVRVRPHLITSRDIVN